MLRFTRSCTSVTADAFSIIYYKPILHSVLIYKISTSIFTNLELL